jgi:hypothetical protein
MVSRAASGSGGIYAIKSLIMGLKSIGAKWFARFAMKKRDAWKNQPLETTQSDFKQLIQGGLKTAFGREHDFGSIQTYEDFKDRVPIRNYEAIKPYIERVIDGESNVLWPGKPIYLCKTSGTTSGVKYIPLTIDSLPNHIHSARDALLSYVHETGNSAFADGKMIFLQGSPVLHTKGAIPTGRLSGIVANYVPSYLQGNRMPSWDTNCMEDWEAKVEKIVEETLHEDMRLISGIPSWVQMYFEKLIETSGKSNVLELFPNFSLFVYGGVNFAPYRKRFEELIGKSIPSIELYPASEGFIAYQDSQYASGMLLILNSGIFYEFIPASQFHEAHPSRLQLKDIELEVDYVLIINNNAGLWGYNIGDTIRFVSKKPYRIIVTGRIAHFISAFGEHVIGKEVEQSIQEGLNRAGGILSEFTVAPQVSPKEGLPYHEWFIEFTEEPYDLENFAQALDQSLQSQNVYYRDLIQGNILSRAKISRIKKDGFKLYMQSIGKLGGQNKVPRLSNDRKIADGLTPFLIS